MDVLRRKASGLGLKVSRLTKSQIEKALLDVVYTKSGIPKVVHQIWIGGKIPRLHNLYMKSWKNMPGWNYRLWGNKDITKNNFPYTYDHIQKSLKIGEDSGNVRKKYAQVADLMRLEILFQHGGMYIDTTIEAIKDPFSLLDQKNHDLVLCNEDPCGFKCLGFRKKKYISNSFIAAIPGNKQLAHLISKPMLQHINWNMKRVNVATGPYYLGENITPENGVVMLHTNVFYPHIFDTEYREFVNDSCMSFQHLDGITNMKMKQGSDQLYLQYPCKQFPKSYGIKHWNVGGTWITKESDISQKDDLKNTKIIK